MRQAATMCGISPAYVWAALTVLRAEDPVLVERVRRGQIPLSAAAAGARKKAKLLAALREADPADVIATFKTYGAATVFDRFLVPAAE
jgi:hypothetical protein